MKEKLNVTKSTGSDVTVPMAIMGESADDTEEGPGNC